MTKIEVESQARVRFFGVQKFNKHARFEFVGTYEQVAIAKELCNQSLETIQMQFEKHLACLSATGGGEGGGMTSSNHLLMTTSSSISSSSSKPPRHHHHHHHHQQHHGNNSTPQHQRGRGRGGGGGRGGRGRVSNHNNGYDGQRRPDNLTISDFMKQK